MKNFLRSIWQFVIVRPGLEGWNANSINMNLEEMLIAIGEPVKRWRRK